MSFRPSDTERSMAGDVVKMKWNPRMDLTAIILKSGEVCLHRLAQWQKVWALPAVMAVPREGGPDTKKQPVQVRDIEWRPDGRILAIAYARNVLKMSDGFSDHDSCVALVDVENAELVHVIDVEGDVTSLSWPAKPVPEEDKDKKAPPPPVAKPAPRYELPNYTDFLPKLKPMAKSFARNVRPMNLQKLTEHNLDDLMKVASQDELNMLAVGTSNGVVAFYALGLLKCGEFQIPNNSPVAHLALSEDLDMCTVLSRAEKDKNATVFSLSVYNVRHIRGKEDQFLMVAKIKAQVIALLRYMSEAITAILETWEDILLEIDSKLSHYQTEGQTLLSDDFMELLVFGTPSAALDKFLQELTDKGLKKLGQSIELTYSNIQKLIVINLQLVAHHLICHLNTLKGICLWDMEFGDIGLEITDIHRSMRAVGSLVLKAVEVQQVIDTSVRHVKAFFRWLYTVMIRLYSDSSNASPEAIKLSQQDIQFVSEFIEENFESNDFCDSSDKDASILKFCERRPTSSTFTLDRVGQYLKNEELTHRNTSMNNFDLNPWMNFLKNKPFFPKCEPQQDDYFCLFPHNVNTSLVQEHRAVNHVVPLTFDGMPKNFAAFIDRTINIEKCTTAVGEKLKSNEPKIACCSVPDGMMAIMGTTGLPLSRLYFVRFSRRDVDSAFASCVVFTIGDDKEERPLKIADYDIYNNVALTMLLVEDTGSGCYLAQVPFAVVTSEFTTIKHSDTSKLESCTRLAIKLSAPSSVPGVYFTKVDNAKALYVAVSGNRKVACVASSRRTRVFETDVPEEEEAPSGQESTLLETTVEDTSMNTG